LTSPAAAGEDENAERVEIQNQAATLFERMDWVVLNDLAAKYRDGTEKTSSGMWKLMSFYHGLGLSQLNHDCTPQFALRNIKLVEQWVERIFSLFVLIAIAIASMGLYGLAALSTERRTKEVGLRKTFGARTTDIILLLLWQFSIPVLIANVIAWPVAYYYLHYWLEGYAYRINLSPLYFVGAGTVALVIAWATVIVHAAHVARANPVRALRYE